MVEKKHRSWLSSRPANITVYVSTIMWRNTGLYKPQQAKTAPGWTLFSPSSVLGQGARSCGWEGVRTVAPFETKARALLLDNAKRSETFLWHKSEFGHFGRPSSLDQAERGRPLSWQRKRGEKWKKCCQFLPARHIGQGHQLLSCSGKGKWFIFLAEVFSAAQSRRCCQGCKALLKHSQKVLDEGETFVHRYRKVCTALSSVCAILLSVVRMWFHIVAKNWLQRLCEEPPGILSFFYQKIILRWLFARALSVFSVYPGVIQATVPRTHFSGRTIPA